MLVLERRNKNKEAKIMRFSFCNIWQILRKICVFGC